MECKLVFPGTYYISIQQNVSDKQQFFVFKPCSSLTSIGLNR